MEKIQVNELNEKQLENIVRALAKINLKSEMLICQEYDLPDLTDEEWDAYRKWIVIVSNKQFEIVDNCKKKTN